MFPFPLLLEPLLGKAGMYIVFLILGFLFGYVLETAGFNHAPTLAAQFYFKDLRVFKVFFTAIVVAMLLIFGASAIGLLDYNLIWVNPTYLWSGILGGLIMGVGFILGGFCPGTSLVALATLKIDGIFFVLGGLVGVFTFGETVGFFTTFFEGSSFGRVTLMDIFNLPTGVIILLVTLMAIFMLWGGEQLERIYGGKDLKMAPKWRIPVAGGFVLFAVLVMMVGQPNRLELAFPSEENPAQQSENGEVAETDASTMTASELALLERSIFIHPGELLDTMHDHKINLIMLDVRNEADYNLFHILDAEHFPSENIPDLIEEFHMKPENTVFVVMSNDETAAVEAWKVMVAEAVPNVYILEGGINRWLSTFATEFEGEYCAEGKQAEDDELSYKFTAALGSDCPAAYPDYDHYELEYEPKIELELKRAPSGGGCG
jgi:rhodanese-related sulfurtransferase